MKKYCFGFLIVFMFLVSCVLPVPVSASEYDLFNTGRVSFTAEVPDDFDEIIFVTLMDDEGGFQQFPIVSEGDYRLVENIVCGPYRISGFVDNDPWFEYTVLRDQEYISVTTEKDVVVKLTVVKGGAGEIIEETAPSLPPETEEVTEPSETIIEDDVSVPEETSPSEDPAENGSGEDAEAIDSAADGEDDGKFNWKKLLSSILISLVFALIVIFIVHFVRERME